jgi:type I restriction enzyme S subunit
MAWEWKTLDQLGSVSRGRSKHRPRDDESLYGGIYPFIQTADVKRSNFYITEYSQTYNERGLAQSKLWRAGTLCFTIAANIADSAILGIDACFPDSIMGFIPYEGVSDVRFVKYCFDVLQQQCKQISQGATQDNLSWEKLSTIKFPAPDYKTQQKIADILSAYDNLIENNQKQIKLLEEAAQRLYKQWFIDLRYPGHETTKIVDGLPEGWRKDTVDSIVSLLSGFAFKNNSFSENGVFKIVTIKNVQDGIFDGENVSLIDEIPAKMSEHCILNSGDILLSLTGNVGRVCMVVGENYLLNQRVAKLKSDYPSFTYCLFRSKDMFDEMNNLANGAAQQNLSPIRTGQIKITVPSADILKMFENRISPLISRMLILWKQNKYLIQFRNRLLPKLMNGEILA